MALRGLSSADESLLLRHKTEELNHFSELSGRHSSCHRYYRGNMAFGKKKGGGKTNEKAGQCVDGVWDVSGGTTLANSAKAKLVAKDSV